MRGSNPMPRSGTSIVAMGPSFSLERGRPDNVPYA